MKDIFPQVEERLKFMDRVGLSYLTLDRATNTLSGGEAQRIRLAAQLGSNLSGVLYVFDEPSIGLHARDNDRLIHTLEKTSAISGTPSSSSNMMMILCGQPIHSSTWDPKQACTAEKLFSKVIERLR